jgi:hypothetical protein
VRVSEGQRVRREDPVVITTVWWSYVSARKAMGVLYLEIWALYIRSPRLGAKYTSLWAFPLAFRSAASNLFLQQSHRATLELDRPATAPEPLILGMVPLVGSFAFSGSLNKDELRVSCVVLSVTPKGGLGTPFPFSR